MAFRVNTNVSSLNTQRWLGISGSQQSKALERLSSGYKINKASDDAAGIAIATKLSVKSVSLTKSIDNGNQALSMLQTAEGGIDQISNILTRLKEIATQSASDNTVDRTALDEERSNLEAEITKIASNTKYGSTSLLQGTKTLASTGSALTAANGIEDIDVTNASTSGGSTFTLTMTAASGGISTLTLTNGTTTQTVTVSGLTGLASSTANFSAFGIKMTVNAAAADITTGGGFVVASGGTTTTSVTNVGASLTAANGVDTITVSAGATAGDYKLALGITGGSGFLQFNLYDSAGTFLDFVAGSVDLTVGGATDSVTSSTYGITIGVSNALNAVAPLSWVSGDDTSFTVTSTTTSSASSFDFQLGDTNDTSARISASLKSFEYNSSDVLGLSGSIATKADAQAYMTSIDNAISNLTTERGKLGAAMNQISYHVANMETMTENIDSSISTLRDADFAKEMADFTKAQILQQSGVAMLAQANSIPQQVLSLLKG